MLHGVKYLIHEARNMTYQKKQTIVSLIYNIIASTIYFIYVLSLFNSGNYDMGATIKFWAQVILILVPVLVIPKIIIIIIFNIINIIVTKEEEDPLFTDELDKLIELKSTRNFYHIFIVGLFISMAVVVLTMSVSAMFIILLLSFIISGIAMDISQLYFYKRGI